MKKVLIDLNIILDFLSKRDDHEAALAVYDLCIKKKIKGYVSSHEITTLSYFLEKEKYPILKRNKIINHLLDNLSVLAANATILRKALESEIVDYEDAVIDELALHEKVDFIITRNIKDFGKSSNDVITARESIEYLESESD
ncbi:PIN domain-containing protein [Marispirochaeta aestuarii]|uniref:PIN domain-containing protein n=1 Tax=Marispirochaeta aestuarii TaxID=1963862 RepID=UPI002ABDA485|nr:PIN domain-containing protein [Marispirochaeta aestuarii]